MQKLVYVTQFGAFWKLTREQWVELCRKAAITGAYDLGGFPELKSRPRGVYAYRDGRRGSYWTDRSDILVVMPLDWDNQAFREHLDSIGEAVMKNGDLIVQGERVDALDLSKFAHEGEMEVWRDEAIKVGIEQRLDTVEDEWFRNNPDCVGLEELFSEDFVTAFRARVREFHDAHEKERRSHRAAKNLDLVVLGVPAGETDFTSIKTAEAFTDWEAAAYEAYGVDRCKAENIQYVGDLFGYDFSSKFFRERDARMTEESIAELEAEIAERQATIASLKANTASGKGNFFPHEID